MAIAIGRISVPDSKLAHQITELVRDTASPLLFHHFSRVFYWRALIGARRGLTFVKQTRFGCSATMASMFGGVAGC
jgi:hypothetical protein